MKIKHFFSERQLSQNEKRELMSLVEACELIHDKSLKSVLSEDEEKSVICAFGDDGGLCGFISVLDEDYDIYIGELYVAASQRGKGYSKILLKKSYDFARSKGYDNVVLCVGHSNLRARKIYENEKFLYCRTNIALSVMKKYLSNEANLIGKIIYKLVKTHGVANLAEVVEKLKDGNELKKHFLTKNIEKIEKCINSETFNASVGLVKELFAGQSLLADAILNGQYEKMIGTKFENIKDLKTACLGVKVFLDLKNQEKVEEQLFKYKEKDKMS